MKRRDWAGREERTPSPMGGGIQACPPTFVMYIYHQMLAHVHLDRLTLTPPGDHPHDRGLRQGAQRRIPAACHVVPPPQKTMYQTFKTVIDYLIESNKIAIDAGGKVCWIFDPDLARRYLGRDDLQIR